MPDYVILKGVLGECGVGRVSPILRRETTTHVNRMASSELTPDCIELLTCLQPPQATDFRQIELNHARLEVGAVPGTPKGI